MIKKTVVKSEEFNRILKRIAFEIVEKNFNRIKNVAFIGIKKRGVPLAYRLKEIIKENEGFDIPIGELDISLYRDDYSQVSSEPMISSEVFDFSFSDKHLIIIDDILHSGRTVRAAMESVLDHGKPKKVTVCVMADTGRRILPVAADFIGKKIRISKYENVDLKIKEIDNEDIINIIKKEGK